MSFILISDVATTEIVFKPSSMDTLLNGMEAKFLNVVKRIDSDLKSLWKTNEVLNKKFNEMSTNVADLKTNLLSVNVTRKEDLKFESIETKTVVLSDFDLILQKLVGFAKDNKNLAVVVFSLFCIYNIVSLLSHFSVCLYFCFKNTKNVEKHEKDMTKEEINSMSFPEPIEERKTPSPPPLPEPDYPNLNEISFEGPLTNAQDDLKPKIPMRTFSIPPNFRMRPHVYMPTKEDYKHILAATETPKTPNLPTRTSSLPPKSPKLPIGSQSVPLKRRALKHSALPDKTEFVKKLKFVESPTPPRKIIKETSV